MYVRTPRMQLDVGGERRLGEDLGVRGPWRRETKPEPLADRHRPAGAGAEQSRAAKTPREQATSVRAQIAFKYRSANTSGLRVRVVVGGEASTVVFHTTQTALLLYIAHVSRAEDEGGGESTDILKLFGVNQPDEPVTVG